MTLADAFLPVDALLLGAVSLALILTALVFTVALCMAAARGDRQAAACRRDVADRSVGREFDAIDFDWAAPEDNVVPFGRLAEVSELRPKDGAA